MEVLKQSSPAETPAAPAPLPQKTPPSASTRTAVAPSGFCDDFPGGFSGDFFDLGVLYGSACDDSFFLRALARREADLVGGDVISS
jgi:hypothetical protein